MPASNSKGRALLSLRIAGVQRFIDTARTTEDFWASSYLISHFSEEAVNVIRRDFEAEMIFPAVEALNQKSGAVQWDGRFPNGILVVVPVDRAADAGKSVERAIHDEWRRVMDSVGEAWARGGLLGDAARTIWDRHAGRATFEIYWAFVPWADEMPYEDVYRRVQRLMEARKTLRNFDAGLEPGWKCSQCGVLQALQDDPEFRFDPCREYWTRAAAAGRRLTHRFRSSERLCTVCITCRLAKRVFFDGRTLFFPSTSSIAVAPLRARLLADPELRAKGEAFTADIRKLGDQVRAPDFSTIDGDWFFDSTYDPKKADREFGIKDARALESAKESFDEFNKTWPAKPQGYVALLTADGDYVGDHINKAIQGSKVATRHQQLSASLSRISGAARGVIEGPFCLGQMVYSGGDDVLALLPAGTILAGLEQLIAAIQHEAVMGPGFSVSASVLILPHSDSLSGAIREGARLMREEAKTGYQRACVVITVRRTSGQQTAVALPWKAGNDSPIGAFRVLVEAMGAEPGSPSAISARLVGHFAEMEQGLRDIDTLLVQKMAIQLLARQSNASTESPLFAAQSKAIQILSDTAYQMSMRATHLRPPPAPSEIFLNMLVTARFLSRMQESK